MKEEIRTHRDALLTENRSLKIQLEAARIKAETESRESAGRALLFLERIRTLFDEKKELIKKVDELENVIMQKDYSIK